MKMVFLCKTRIKFPFEGPKKKSTASCCAIFSLFRLVSKFGERGEVLDGGVRHELAEDVAEVIGGLFFVIRAAGAVMELEILLVALLGDVSDEPGRIVIEFVDEMKRVEVLVEVIEGEEDVHGAGRIDGAVDEDAILVILRQGHVRGEANAFVFLFFDFEIELVEFFGDRFKCASGVHNVSFRMFLG